MEIFRRSNYYLTALKKAMVDESTDPIYCLLMRSGFVFDRTKHSLQKNIITNTGAIALVWATADNSVSRSSGSFITDGFVPGNRCYSDDTVNTGYYYISTVTALKITFSGAITGNSSATKTLSSNDQLLTGHGYTASSKLL